jgi:putative intracellular protease/amidase
MIAKAYRRNDKIVATLCSGVSTLLGARAEDGSWPFVGKTMTGFPTSEMADFGVAAGAPWLPEQRLTDAGANYMPGQKHTDVVLIDGNLITGQNGASSRRTAMSVIDRVNATRRALAS